MDQVSEYHRASQGPVKLEVLGEPLRGCLPVLPSVAPSIPVIAERVVTASKASEAV